MYHSVYQKLKEGGCIGIFPEGGSHDRTDLLPLKAGVSIMALGALSANPDLKLRIVPVGLSYFHPHRFRSRAVVEFGSPIEIPAEFVEGFNKGGDEKRSSISGMMDLVVNGLKSVTVRAPDYETLMVSLEFLLSVSFAILTLTGTFGLCSLSKPLVDCTVHLDNISLWVKSLN